MKASVSNEYDDIAVIAYKNHNNLNKKIMFIIWMWPVAIKEAGDYFLRILVNEKPLRIHLSPPS